MDIIFIILFLLGSYYLLHYRLNLRKAAETSKNALYPITEDEFSSILLPNEYKEMEPLTKGTKSYQYVKWGTWVALFLLVVLLWLVLTTDWFESSAFTVVYLFIAIITAIRHRGNLFILPKGLILNGKYYSTNQIKYFETEQIIKWHELYGLHSRINNAYKLSFKVRNNFFQPGFVVIEDKIHLERIATLLKELDIPEKTNIQKGPDTSLR
ncbi:hypothetical protein IMZ08_06150 [Bacillus luteolus]|uniref:DUF5673 domain-containing protein n=1 Tax=Litchfieldia luteola TaxID=682179 RepID=A0ABR9QGL1_9BACI|nr:hypothetical protein [Cytobacillus luteolus]MBE4907632.1 hypothetical protein [Cytobacillus luteolus]MBP1941083.1 hypothetical protein [Cytobacillus luteolus]